MHWGGEMNDLPSWNLQFRRMSLLQDARNDWWLLDKLVDLVSQGTGLSGLLDGLESWPMLPFQEELRMWVLWSR